MLANSLTGTVLRATLCLFILSVTGCKKEDKQQDDGSDDKYDHIDLSGTVMHHDRPIPQARVYLKKNTTIFPGGNPGLYDFSTEADGDANFHFHGLEPASYYLYGEGWDTGINDSVFGGVPVTVTGTSQTQRSNVPVTE